MFITMVHHTTENAPQYAKIRPHKPPVIVSPGSGAQKYGDDDIDLMNYLGVDYLEISQTICRPYTLLKGGQNTIHRGIANRSGIGRPLSGSFTVKQIFKLKTLSTRISQNA